MFFESIMIFIWLIFCLILWIGWNMLLWCFVVVMLVFGYVGVVVMLMDRIKELC